MEGLLSTGPTPSSFFQSPGCASKNKTANKDYLEQRLKCTLCQKCLIADLTQVANEKLDNSLIFHFGLLYRLIVDCDISVFIQSNVDQTLCSQGCSTNAVVINCDSLIVTGDR